MNTLKKIFAVAAATATMGVMSFATIGASAAPAPVDAPPYEVVMSVVAGGETQWDICPVEVTGDGSYSSSYTFTLGSGSIELLLFDSNLNLYTYAPEECTDVASETSVRMVVDTIKIVRVAGGEDVIPYTASDTAFRAGDNGSCMRLNILNTWTTDQTSDINVTEGNIPGGGVNAGDQIVVDWTITGLGNGSGGDNNDNTGDTTTTTTTSGDNSGTTTTTTTKKNNSGSSSNNSNKNNSSSNSTTSTVTQTADAGVVAIVVGAAAAASLAVGAVTFSKKRK